MERQQTFEQYIAEIFSRKGSKGKVRDSLGVYDVYKKLRKNHWYNIGRPVKEKEFYAIIRGVNKLLAEELAQGNTVTFPFRMGKLELRKFQVGVKLVDGKVKVTYPINWSETLRLWYNDAEAEKQKILMRTEVPWAYHIRYCTEGRSAKYPNKNFYQFAVNTFIKRALKHNIKQGKVDALW